MPDDNDKQDISDRKIRKLNAQIEKFRTKREAVETDMEKVKGEVREKIITRAEFTEIKQGLQQKIRDINVAIRRKEKARLNRENVIREKLEGKK